MIWRIKNMELTREEAISEHRKMWNWIADKVEKRKERSIYRRFKKRIL